MSFSENKGYKRYLTDIKKAYAEDEALYEAAVKDAARKILDKRTVRMVFIAGPSCSGKTPTKEKLAHFLNSFGVKTELISLDDFYRSPHDNIYHEDGTPDYESPESLDTELLHGCFSALCEGKSAWMPKFIFPEKRRSDSYTRMSLEDDELCIVEGLHALNYDVCGSYIDSAKTFRLYLDAECPGVGDVRLLRRLVRDYYKRGSTAELTLSMWDNVEDGSRRYIFPYRDGADVRINTYIGYERCCMRDDALLILKEVPETSPQYEKARELVLQLLQLPSFPKAPIPPHSVMREFITQRD